MKQQLITLGFAVVALLLGGCGGDGGSSQCTSRGSTETPCSATARACYVSTQGSDSNDGSANDPSHAFRSIDRALDVVPSNYAIIISPGTYFGGITTDREGRCAPEALSLIADSNSGPVVIDARNAAGGTGIRLTNGDDSIIDGFTIINSPGAGILVRSQSDRVQIRNNIIRASGSDGIRVQDSSDLLIFNNLIYGNNGIGIALVGTSGSPRGRVINNTVAFNAGRGVEIGRSDGASGGTFTRNNIIQENAATSSQENIKVFDNSIPSYDGNFNLVFPATYVRQTIRGVNDQNEDARFSAGSANADPSGFRLRLSSPAIDRGATNLGSSLSSLVQILLMRSTVAGGGADTVPVDIGYHFPL